MRFVKIISLFVCAVVLVTCAVSCNGTTHIDPPVDSTVYYTVRFETLGGTEIGSVQVKAGSLIPEPAIPEKAGYIFDGWKNSEGRWLFSVKKVTADTTLTAIWLDVRSVFEYEINDAEEATITKYKGNIESLRVPETIGGFPVVAIGERAFYEANPDTTFSITVGKSVRSIGKAAFYDCAGIAIKIEGKLEAIGEQAFFGCDGLESIKLSSGVTEIGYETFSGCTALRDVVLSDTVARIAENAFELCSSLKTLTVYSSLEAVEDSAFESCDSLAAIYYHGSADAWESIEIAQGNKGNSALTDAKLYLYSETEPEDSEAEYFYYDSNGKVRVW